MVAAARNSSAVIGVSGWRNVVSARWPRRVSVSAGQARVTRTLGLVMRSGGLGGGVLHHVRRGHAEMFLSGGHTRAGHDHGAGVAQRHFGSRDRRAEHHGIERAQMPDAERAARQLVEARAK